MLVAAVRALAHPPDAQLVGLNGASIDDLALDLDAQPWHDEEPAIRRALDELDALLDAMSGNQNSRLWTPSALHGPEWEHVRQAARRVLALDRQD